MKGEDDDDDDDDEEDEYDMEQIGLKLKELVLLKWVEE